MSKAEKLCQKWLGFTFSSGGETGEDYKSFQREARAAIKELADKANYAVHTFLGNHYSFSVVLRERETGAFTYISISDVRFWKDEWATNVLYRQMKDDTDWCGGQNHYCRLLDLPKKLEKLHE